MKVKIIFIGKTKAPYLLEGIEEYKKRLKKYLNIQWIVIPEIKKARYLSKEALKQKEGEKLVNSIGSNDYLVLLDDKGTSFTSEMFATFWQKKFNSIGNDIVLVVGGAFGFSEAIYERANEKISLSKMTFSHQMIRLFLAEQLYRAMTILRNEPYHH